MNLLDHLRSVRRTFTGHRVRAALTLLGIIIGTGSIVALAGLLRGAEESLMRLNQGVSESDTIRIRRDEPPMHQLERATRPLSKRDAEEIDRSPLFKTVAVTTVVDRESNAQWNGREKRVRLVGASPKVLGMYRLAIEKGRFIIPEDMVGGRRVAVVGQEVWTELLEKMPSPMGQQVTIDDETWTIVGVLANKPVSGHGTGTWMWNRRVLVPQTAFDATFDPTGRVGSIFMKVEEPNVSESRVLQLGKVASGLVLRLHMGVKNFVLDDRSGQKQEELILSIIQILLLGTGLMSLFVGGINIMNIMLVTVTERTREIGIRRAIGASPSAILVQFLLEAAVIALTGGVLGVLGGIAFTWLVGLGLAQAFDGWNFHVELWAVGLGLALSLVTGIVFGLFPAWRAGRLNPVEALRYE
jgi:putative ABC transport system permease protein